ncbi:hypothetical protein ACHWQZ_G000048 [Mnemiopsis leidyi]
MFLFFPLSSQCGLLIEVQLRFGETPTKSNLDKTNQLHRLSILGNMYCITISETVRYGCGITDCVVERSLEGLYIQNAWSGRCLTLDDSPGGSLKWKRCVSASSWSIEVLRTNGDLQIKVHPFNDLSLCIEGSLFDGVLLPIVSVSNCSDSINQELILNRSLQLDAFGVQRNFLILGSDLFYLYTDNKSSESQNIRKSLTDIRFLNYSELEGPCHHVNLKVKNGKILGESAGTFYLPGTNLTVLCEAGYGVKGNGYSQLGWFVCYNELTRPPRCSKMSIGRKKSPNEGTFWKYSIILNVVLGVGIFILFAVFVSKETKKVDKETEDSNTTMSTMNVGDRNNP